MSSNIPSLPLELHQHIASFLDCPTRVVFSGVNKEIFKTLSNDLYFADHFKNLHPLLATEPFTKLRSYHPMNCWKIACCTFEKKSMDSFFSATERTKPFIFQVLQSEKEFCENNIRLICGSKYKDPDSAIHQAYVAMNDAKLPEAEVNKKMQEYQNSMQTFQNKNSILMPKLSNFHTQQELAIIVPLFFCYECIKQMKFTEAKTELKLLEAKIREWSDPSQKIDPNDPQLALLKGKAIPEYLELCQSSIAYINFSELDALLKSSGKSYSEKQKVYQELESNRIMYQNRIDFINQRLPVLQSQNEITSEEFDELYTHPLRNEFDKALDIEARDETKKQLEECLELIQKLINDEELKTPENLERIRNLINSHPILTNAWGILYSVCANQAQGDLHWSENHFSEYLPILGYILQRIKIELA